MSGGGNDQKTTTTETKLTPQQTELMNLALPGVRSFAASVPQRYQGTTTAPFDPSQVAGQNMALDAAGTQGNLAKSGADASQFYTSGDIWNPSSNPGLQTAIDAAVRPITQNYQNTVLPAIRSDAISTGNFGGSRQGVSEGLAAQGYQNAVGDTAAKLAQAEYGANLDAQLKAIGLLPTVQGAQVQPALTTSGVGDVRQQQAQRLLSEGAGNFNYDTLAPFLQSQEILSLAGGLPGGGTTATTNNPAQNPWMQSLGGAATGASLGATLGGPVGGGVGAAGGALLPWLFR